MQSPSTAHQSLFDPEPQFRKLIVWCQETVKFYLLEGKHLFKAFGKFSFLTYLCGRSQFTQVCTWVVLVLWQWLGCCCCCRQKEVLEQTVASQDKWLMTKGENVFLSKNPFSDESRLLRCIQVVLFQDTPWIFFLYFRTWLLLTSDKFPCSRLTVRSLRNRINFFEKFSETEFCMRGKSAETLRE